MLDLGKLRIVEIGAKPYVKTAFPASVDYYSTRLETLPPDRKGQQILSLKSLAPLLRQIRNPEVALIVCQPTYFPPWHWQSIVRIIFDRRLFSRPFSLIPGAGPQFLRGRVTPPIAILDHEDLPVINRQNLFLLDRSTVYFKRELPPDYWRLFFKTSHANLPTPRFRLKARHARRIEKIMPISLGLPLSSAPPPPPTIAPPPKTADIFFAGRIEGSSTVRARGLAEILKLRKHGVVVDIPDRPLPQDEFYRRCGSAWLTWSPEGLGWDCFRHYEAPIYGSIPLINAPTIERHQPLLAGVHAVYYDVEPGGLSQAVVEALANKDRLRKMAAAARAHVLAHHTTTALARYIVDTTLARRAALASNGQ